MSEVKLPSSWTCVSLDEISNFIDYRGRTPLKTTSGIPLITAKNIRDGFINSEPREYISEDDYDNWMTRGIPQFGDVVITTEAPMGNVAIIKIKEKFAMAQRAICLQFFEYDMSRFSHYALRSPEFQKLLTLNATGTTVSGIKAATLKKLQLPIPSINEQKIIADKLDTLLARVDSTKARLEQIPQILKRFRQAVLAAAVNGKLTEEWRDINPSEKWETVKLLDIIVDKPRNGYSPKGVEYETAIKNLTLSAVTKGYFIENCFKYVDIDISNDSYLWVKNGDILIQRANSLEYVGVSAIYEGKDNQYIYPDLMMKFRVNERILTKYLHYSLLSELTREYFRKNASGTTGNMPKINQGTVSAAPVNLPPISEQTEIVRRVEQLFAYADGIEKQVQNALERVNNLTQSILAKAFRGELTAQWRAENPDLISGENSAQALLAKIQQQRANTKTAKRGSSKR